MAEMMELEEENNKKDALFHAVPLEEDLFEWHFTVRGPPASPFEGGLYHGRLLLPSDYPYKAPEIMILTPSGRFEVGTRICLSVTSFHQETWQPSWGIRTILTAMIGFMPSKAEGIGALDYSADERRVLARRSWDFTCPMCKVRCKDILTPHDPASSSSELISPVEGDEKMSTLGGNQPSNALAARAPSDEEDAATTRAHDPQPKNAQVSQKEETTVLDDHPLPNKGSHIPAGPFSSGAEDSQGPGESNGAGPVVARSSGTPSEASHDPVNLIVPATSSLPPRPSPGGSRWEDGSRAKAYPNDSIPRAEWESNPVPRSAVIEDVKEKQLLYLAFIIAGAIVAILLRRISGMISEENP
uniref:UBC core domain-containing protein n=1 Tax=Compsopogon caeruleus TaxID=31354 RepID=A0A7S1XFM3_9RHOD